MALDSANPAHVRSPAAFLRWALLALWVAACAAVAWQGGAWAVGAATAAALPCLLGLRTGAGAGTGAAAAPAPAPSAARRKGDADLPAQVVPVWQRNIEAARQHSERSAETLMTSFASVSSNLDQALGDDAGGASLQLGAAEDLLQRHQPQIDTLLRSTLNVVDMKNKMLEGVSGLAQTLSAMQQLTRQVQEIGRSTHLLALNASVEATRAGAAGGGFAVVATEVRELAAQSRQIGQKLANHVDEVQERLRALISQARRDDTDADEMGLQAEENARAVVAGLVGSLAEFMRSSSTLREVSRQVQGDLEKIFMGLQSQDRLNQMLSIVRDDMERFNRWARGESDDAAGEPHLWLERLEAHYTMEEQHSSHHNAQVVEKAAAVEFF